MYYMKLRYVIAAAWAGREWADESYEEGLGRLDPVASLQVEINMLPVKWEAIWMVKLWSWKAEWNDCI